MNPASETEPPNHITPVTVFHDKNERRSLIRRLVEETVMWTAEDRHFGFSALHSIRQFLQFHCLRHLLAGEMLFKHWFGLYNPKPESSRLTSNSLFAIPHQLNTFYHPTTLQDVHLPRSRPGCHGPRLPPPQCSRPVWRGTQACVLRR